ncbi:hypothetical protein TNCV_3139851 [Trichonephila clavipes]|nr:hypothetical protein TNCV_3139851 [Trichonephila clavipes]
MDLSRFALAKCYKGGTPGGRVLVLLNHTVPCRNCGGGDRVVSRSNVPSGNFTELIRTVNCMVLKANDRRTSSPLPR